MNELFDTLDVEEVYTQRPPPLFTYWPEEDAVDVQFVNIQDVMFIVVMLKAYIAPPYIVEKLLEGDWRLQLVNTQEQHVSFDFLSI